ncbi:MAG: hypothetical protein U0936_06720 [Planctomycetaceae bacterium]
MAGNLLQENQTDGTTSFTLLLTDGLNNAPVNSIPPRQNVNEDATLVFSAAKGNAITVTDQDAYLGLPSPSANLTANDGVLGVTLLASNGRLTLGKVTGLTFTVGNGIDDTTMTFSGTIADINAALDGLIYDSTQDFFDLVSNAMTVTTSDSGNFGPLQSTRRRRFHRWKWMFWPRTTSRRSTPCPIRRQCLRMPVLRQYSTSDRDGSPAFERVGRRRR